MAFLPTKTYSRRNNEFLAPGDREKENIDPFDELISSPLKQDVQFQPLSFWDKKEKDRSSKKRIRSVKCGLYETSDSDENSSPFRRKRKPKSKNLVSKKSLQSRSTNMKFNIRSNNSNNNNNNDSDIYSLAEKSKPQKSVTPNVTESFIGTEKFKKNNVSYLNKTLYLNENMEETLKSACTSCDNFKHYSARGLDADDNIDSFYSYLNSAQFKGSKKKSFRKFINEKSNESNSNFVIYEDTDALHKEQLFDEDKTIVAKEESINSSLQFCESMEETVKSFYKDCDSFKFVNIKRQFNHPSFYILSDASVNDCLNSTESSENHQFLSFSQYFSKNFCSPTVQPYKDVSLTKNCVNKNEEKNYISTLGDDGGDDDNDNEEDEYFINNTLMEESNDNTFDIVNSLNFTTVITEESKAMSLQEHEIENIFSDNFDFIPFRSIKLKDVIQELSLQQNATLRNNGTTDLNSSSDETLCELQEENTVIRVALESETNPTPNQGFEEEKEKVVYSASSSHDVSHLSSRISDLTISSVADVEIPVPKTKKSGLLRSDAKTAAEEDSFLIDLRNVTTKRRGFLSSRYDENIAKENAKNTLMENISQGEFEFDQTLQLPRVTDRMSLDSNKSIFFPNPMFESTRLLDISCMDKKISKEPNLLKTVLEESALDHTYALKSGKKWLRSMSILKQLQNGNISEGKLENARITGRNFESFVRDIKELQNANNKILSKTYADMRNSFSDDLGGYQTVLNLKDDSTVSQYFSSNNSILTKNTTDNTLSEKVLLNHTVKVIRPEEVSTGFKTALGLESSNVTTEEDFVGDENSSLSARNFILLQCGQDAELPFEEYFNERTLKNCKKIGEGVYGEVFMCSDTVIKIIPIEGLDKVNGEPQKTFEEIISEVVIAAKLSNLRNGKKNRTDGFSELKRCWCVKGKYPKHLLRLWNEYDQLGSGSENDSPVMFKDDQLYIILELANGGKDLESFVFSSAAQSLSLFIQTVFSLAVAEKAYEFEHRDLHWGNVLISETKDKYMTVVLDGTEFKIPTKGVRVCIIDFTLSRINHEGCCIFNDLSVDPGLFTSEGDYQFEIYRMMLRELQNDWSLFRPRNNIFWLHYTVDKMIKMVRYKNRKGKIHAKYLKDLKTLESVVLEHKDSTDFVLSSCLSSIINKL